MRVIQLLPELNEGGVERGVVELNRELVRRGVESLVISAGGRQAAQIDIDGGRHICFDVASKNPLTVALRVSRLRKLIRELQPDILHARSRVPAWLAYLANKKLKIPFVTTVHGFNSVNAYSRVMTYGDKVICVSGAIKKYIQRHYLTPDEKIKVIARGVDLERFDPSRVDQRFMEDFRTRYGLEGRFVVASVGRISQLKDYETFIRGIALASETIPNILGLIVGGARKDKQDYLASLEALVHELGVGKLIKFVGSQAQLPEIYAQSDVVVSSSKKPESFGRTAAESLAMNVPVVATNHGGVLDIVIPHQTGALFKPQDVDGFVVALQEVESLKGNSLRPFVVNRFSLTNMVEETLGIYKELYDKSSTIPESIIDGEVMVENDFGKYSLPSWAQKLAGFCQSIPVNWWTKRLLFILRKPIFLLRQTPIDATIKSARFRLYPDQNLSDKRLLCTPDQLDGIERRLLEERLEKGSTVVDLGANIGGYSLLLAAVRPDLKIVAVEADPELAKRFEMNTHFSGYGERVKLMNVAVSDAPGRLMLQRDPVNRGKNTVVEVSVEEEAVEIEAVPLLEILDSNQIERPAAIKLDIEGFELNVLNGFFSQAPEDRWPLYIQLEQHRKENYDPAVKLTLQKGYRLLKRTRMNVVLALDHEG